MTLYIPRSKSPIKGLWHKHYYVYQQDFLDLNLKSEVRLNKSLEGAPDIAKVISRALNARVTGEWIIFSKEDEINT
jgi:hypothetical protein